jgi:hypothetical protein
MRCSGPGNAVRDDSDGDVSGDVGRDVGGDAGSGVGLGITVVMDMGAS